MAEVEVVAVEVVDGVRVVVVFLVSCFDAT